MSFPRCDECRPSKTPCARCWLGGIAFFIKRGINDGALVDLLAKDAAKSSLFWSRELGAWVTLRFDMMANLTGGRVSFDSARVTLMRGAARPMWRATIDGEHGHIDGRSLSSIAEKVLRKVAKRDDVVFVRMRALVVNEGAQEIVWPLLMSLGNKPMDGVKAEVARWFPREWGIEE